MRLALVPILIFSASIGNVSADVLNELKITTAEAISCVKGFSAANQIMGKNEFKGGENQTALMMVKKICISDGSVVAFYNATKNGKNAKSLSDIRLEIESTVERWYQTEIKKWEIAEKEYFLGK